MPITRFFTQTATVETITGTGQNGDNFAAPVTLSPVNDPPNGVFVDGMRKVTQSSDGEEVTMTGTVLYTWLASAPLFVPNSRVTVNGQVSRVVGINVNDTGRPTVDHVAVTLI